MKNNQYIKRAKKAVKTRTKRSMMFRGRFIKRYDERIAKEDYKSIPPRIRGIYALLNKSGLNYNVVYVGMSISGIGGRIRSHIRSKRKRGLWTHFSIFEVHDNIYNDEIKELEGLFRVIYAKDRTANALNKQKKFKHYKRIKKNIQSW